MRKFFRNLPYFKQMTIVYVIFVIIFVLLGFFSKGEFLSVSIKDWVSLIFLPILLNIIAIILNKVIKSNEMFVNLKLYDYEQMRKIISADKHKNLPFKIYTDGKKIDKSYLFIEVENTGSTLISRIEININRKVPKSDRYYCLITPILPGNKEYIAIDYNKDSINDILAITYLSNTDKLNFFSSITYTDNFAYFKNHNNNKPNYKHRKTSNNNKIEVYEKYIKL